MYACTTADNSGYLHKDVCFLIVPSFSLHAIPFAHLVRNAGKGGKMVVYCYAEQELTSGYILIENNNFQPQGPVPKRNLYKVL